MLARWSSRVKTPRVGCAAMEALQLVILEWTGRQHGILMLLYWRDLVIPRWVYRYSDLFHLLIWILALLMLFKWSREYTYISPKFFLSIMFEKLSHRTSQLRFNRDIIFNTSFISVFGMAKDFYLPECRNSFNTTVGLTVKAFLQYFDWIVLFK